MSDTVDQPGLKPTSKVTWATAAGAITTLLVFTADQFDFELTGTAAAAVTTLLVFVGGYFKAERKDP